MATDPYAWLLDYGSIEGGGTAVAEPPASDPYDWLKQYGEVTPDESVAPIAEPAPVIPFRERPQEEQDAARLEAVNALRAKGALSETQYSSWVSEFEATNKQRRQQNYVPAVMPPETIARARAEMEALPVGPEREELAPIVNQAEQQFTDVAENAQQAQERGLGYVGNLAYNSPTQEQVRSVPVFPRALAIGALGAGKTVANVGRTLSGNRESADKVNRIWQFQQGLNRAADRDSYEAEFIGPMMAENLGMIGEFMGGAAAVAPLGGFPAIATLYGTSTADEGYTQGIDAGLSPKKAAAYAAGMAALEVGMMYGGGRFAKGFGLKTTEELLSPAVKKAAENLLTKSGIKKAVLGAFVEAGEEGATAFSQQLWGAALGANSTEGIGGNTLRAAFLGLGGSGVANLGKLPFDAYDRAMNKWPDLLKQAFSKNQAAQAARDGLAAKIAAGESISRNDLERAGISSAGTNKKTRAEIAKRELGINEQQANQVVAPVAAEAGPGPAVPTAAIPAADAVPAIVPPPQPVAEQVTPNQESEVPNEVQRQAQGQEEAQAETQAEAGLLGPNFSVDPAQQGSTGRGDVDAPVVEMQETVATPGPQLQPLPQTTKPLPIKSQREIIGDLAKGLKIPIRFGRLKAGPNVGGYFMPIANLIGSKTANDIPVVAHESGHKLDQMFGLSSNKAIASELNVLGDPNTPGSRSSWKKSKSKKYKHGEGVAEFVRYWLTDPQHAAQAAPNTHAAFESALSNNKDLGDMLRQAREDIRLWRAADPQARLRSHVSAGDNPNGTRYTLSQLTRDVVDDLHILRLAVDDAKVASRGGLKPSDNPYLLARNLRGSYGMAESFIRNGVVDFNSKQVSLGTSLEDALKPVAGRVRDFGDWIVAKRAQELHSQGRETGLVNADVDSVVAKFDGEAGFHQAFDAIKKWQDALLQYAVDGGLVTPDSASAMRAMNQDYVPFHRLFEVGAGEAPAIAGAGTGSGLNAGSPGSMKRLRGSTRQIVDPLETMVKNAYAIITATEKTAINRAVADMAKLPDMGRWVEPIKSPQQAITFNIEKVREQLEAAGADVSTIPDDLLLTFFRQSGRAPFGENVIRIVRQGNEEYYRLNRDLFSTFHALDLDDSSKLIRMISAPAQLLRAGVTLEPGFALANILRDTFGAAVISKYGAKPFETTVRGVAALINNPQLVADWAASGGKSSVEANFFDRTKLQKYLAEKISKDLTPTEQAMVVVKSPLTALRWITSIAEEATRIGEYKIAYDQLRQSGMSEGESRRLAAFESRDRQDFAKGGAKTKILRHATAFWNASLQGNVKLAESFKERPLRTTINGLAFVTLPTMLAMAVNWDDEDYWDRPQWERDAFWLIPAGKAGDGHTRFIRIPKPFLIGVLFGTSAERMMQWGREQRPDAMKDIPSLLLKEIAPNPMPQSAQLAYEVGMTGKQGWNVFRQRPIVPDKLADLPPEMQWTEQTSGTAKTIGRAIGVSPLKIDHAISQTTGGIGKVLSGQQIPGERFVSTPLTASNQPSEDFYKLLQEMRTASAGDKAGGEYVPHPLLPVFEMGAERLSELRKISTSSDGLEKQSADEEALQLAKSLVSLHRDEAATIPEDFTGRLLYRATDPAPKKKPGKKDDKFMERQASHNTAVGKAANALKSPGLSTANFRSALFAEQKRRGLSTATTDDKGNDTAFGARLRRLRKLSL